MNMNTRFKWIFATVLFLFLFSCSKNEPSSQKEKFISDTETKLLELEKCIVPTTSEQLEIVTWNIEHFPKDKHTIKNVAAIIKQMQVDVIALQEIERKQDLQTLITQLPDWKFAIHEQSDLNLAYLYNSKTVKINGNPYSILKGNRYELPRSPYILPIHFIAKDMDIVLINNHLKAKSGSENEARRRKACNLLKQWIDNNHKEDNVVLLGDLNDEITDSPKDNVFQIFIDDTTNYKFADMKIANSKKQWSYPSYPSHIDHILISNELFDNMKNIYTYTFNNCDRKYDNIISDHYPVCLVLE